MNYITLAAGGGGIISLKQLQLRRPRRRRRFLPFCTSSSSQDNDNNNCVSGDSIRERFLSFYASRGHKVLPSASLVPDDPTVLLTIAGMLQFKPIFLGKLPRQVPRATTSQRCIRTNDINNVGHTSRHHTFFEMLGNFSFGDYFKKQAIQWAWDLSTIEFRLPPERLWISVYQDDHETFQLWSQQVKLHHIPLLLFCFSSSHHIFISLQVGVPVDRIKRLGEDDNFWTSGVTGPCGPCSEIYYDFHPERGYADAVSSMIYLFQIQLFQITSLTMFYDSGFESRILVMIHGL